MTPGSGHFTLSIHGVTADVTCSVAAMGDRLLEDFAHFAVASAAAADVRISLQETATCAPPGWSSTTGPLGDLIAWNHGCGLMIAGSGLSDPGAYLAEVRPYFAGLVFGRLVRDRVVQQIHASGVVHGEGATLFVGERGSGKSSLALAAAMTGARYLANDIAFLQREESSVVVLGLAQDITLGAAAAEWFERDGRVAHITAPCDPLAEKPRVPARELSSVTRPVLLNRLVFPEPQLRLAAPRARRLDEDEVITRLLSATEVITKWEMKPPLAGMRYATRMFEVISAAARQAIGWHLQWCPDHRHNAQLIADLACD